MADLTDLALLRLYIDDRDTGERPLLFEDPELTSLLTSADGDVHEAASKAWAIKAANVVQWYQANIDGAFLSREQVFEHCLAMQKFHADRSTGGATISNITMTNSFNPDDVDFDADTEF